MQSVEVLSFFDNLLELTRNMVAARNAGDWDTVEEIAAVRIAAIRSYELSVQTEPTTQHQQKIIETCLKIQQLDQEILDEAIEWRSQIKQFLIR